MQDAFRKIFTHKAVAADTIRAVGGDFADVFDLSTIERVPASFVARHLGDLHIDMLWRVRHKDDPQRHVLVLLIIQFTVDHAMARRVADYTLRIRKGLQAEQFGAGGECPGVIPIVIYNGAEPWDAP